MMAVPGERIVAARTRDALGMPALRVHATDYPDIEAQGGTPDEACDRLIGLLDQATDYMSEPWKCRARALALADAFAFTAGVRGMRRIHLHR
jgi:hypothetical protein